MNSKVVKILKIIDQKYLLGLLSFLNRNIQNGLLFYKNRYEYYFSFINKVSFKRYDKVDLIENIASNNKIFMNNAAPTNITQLKYIFKKLIEIDYSLLNDHFIDIGCGEGKVLIVASKFGFKKIIGVEFANNLVKSCANNFILANVNNVSVYLKDAAHYKIPDGSRVFYFYNPFNVIILEKVLNNIEKSILNSNRDAYIVYVDPRHVKSTPMDGYIYKNDSRICTVNKVNQYDSSNPIWSLLKKYELSYENNTSGQPFHIYKINQDIINNK